MATLYLRLSSKAEEVTNKSEILLRFKHGSIDIRAKSGIFVNPHYWNTADQKIMVPNSRIKNALQLELAEAETKVTALRNIIMGRFLDTDKDAITKEWLVSVVDNFHFPNKQSAQQMDIKPLFFDIFDEYLTKRKLSDWRIRAYHVVIRVLKRYELYKQMTTGTHFELDLDAITPLVLQDLEGFLRREHMICEKYPQIYEAVPESRTPQPRGQNTINGILTKIRSFFIWSNDNDKTSNNPFKRYKINECVYGTPFYISIDERNQLFNCDLSHHPALAIQRDIFVFQCVIGCRVGDLYKMTKANVINGAIEYIARKTKEGRPVTVRVPLNAIAKEILARYADIDESRLLPFISEQKYNVAIKEMFRIAGLTRSVTVLNPTTGEPEIRPLDEIASSHLARRCFVGNLYKQVKDPNLVGALSGHKEGSKAFARYREIDEDMKNELVKMLE